VHTNFYFLRLLTKDLEQIVKGTVLSECYSQAKEELILRFETHTKSFYIKANVSPSLHIISFPGIVERARRNSIDLFGQLIGYRVSHIRQFQNERSFAIEFEEGKTLLFKMHGNRSNIILFQAQLPPELFRKNLPQDMAIDLYALDRHIDFSYDVFTQHKDNPKKLYFTFGVVVWQYLKICGFDDLTTEEQWKLIQETIDLLNSPPSFYFVVLGGSLHFSLLPIGTAPPVNGNTIEAINRFFISYTQEFVLEKEKASALSDLRGKLQSSISYQQKTHLKLKEVQQDNNYKQWADLLMAHMHALKQGIEKVALPSFFEPDQMLDIKLKKELTPQQNAAVFYRKAKNQHIEIERLERALADKAREIQAIQEQIDAIEAMDNLKTLRKQVQSLPSAKSTDKKVTNVPYFEFEKSGFRIWVGKNAESNDDLTLHYAYKEDLWLHAKDVAGSHVIIKHQSGKKIPKDVIERAAELAAYNSKRKSETLCPVIVTPRKFVRKRKGDPPGAVVVEREEVILVEPKL
jgi:predicted ribosome quality control (RQC) complex YloA/Tae2 family protein